MTTDPYFDDELEMRKAIIGIEIGERYIPKLTRLTHAQAAKIAKDFGRGRGIPLRITPTEFGPLIERVEVEERQASRYAEIDALKIGQSHTYNLPPSQHRRVRLACNNRARSGDFAYRCNVVLDGIMVTRLPATTAEQLDGSIIPTPPKRPSKWGLERLETEGLLTFNNISPTEIIRLRLSCSQKATITGWKIRCTVKNQNTAHVYRYDEGAPSDSSERTLIKQLQVETYDDTPKPERPSKWGIERLQNEPELVFDALLPVEEDRLRLAAFKKAKAMGWLVRVRIAQGRASVYRMDAAAPADSPARTRHSELPLLSTASIDSEAA